MGHLRGKCKRLRQPLASPRETALFEHFRAVWRRVAALSIPRISVILPLSPEAGAARRIPGHALERHRGGGIICTGLRRRGIVMTKADRIIVFGKGENP